MKIAIDASQVIYGTGVSVYTRLLIEHLLLIDEKNDYLIFGSSLRQKNQLRHFIDTLKGRCSGKIFPYPPTLANIIWNKLHILPIERLIGDVDVFHSSDWTQPPSKAYKVTTVHDLFPIKFPKLTHPKIVDAHSHRLKWVMKEVDEIIVPSETTKEDLSNYQIKGKISVIPQAPDPIFKPATKLEIEKCKRKYQINDEYVISVGINPRKNIERIIAAFEKVRPGLGLKLIVVGYPYIKIEAPRGVKILGHVVKDDLPALYSGSKALVYPSLYEGFGFPILEAYKCEIPVVTSNLGIMLELGKNAAVLVNPEETDSIAEGIVKAIKEKEELIKKGREEVKKYSWMLVAERTLNIYNSIQEHPDLIGDELNIDISSAPRGKPRSSERGEGHNEAVTK